MNVATEGTVDGEIDLCLSRNYAGRDAPNREAFPEVFTTDAFVGAEQDIESFGVAGEGMIQLFDRYLARSGRSLDEVSLMLGRSLDSFGLTLERKLLSLPFEDWVALANLLNIPPDEILIAIDQATLELEQDRFCRPLRTKSV